MSLLIVSRRKGKKIKRNEQGKEEKSSLGHLNFIRSPREDYAKLKELEASLAIAPYMIPVCLSS